MGKNLNIFYNGWLTCLCVYIQRPIACNYEYKFILKLVYTDREKKSRERNKIFNVSYCVSILPLVEKRDQGKFLLQVREKKTKKKALNANRYKQLLWLNVEYKLN